MSRWKDHVAKWKGCQLCELCHTRKNVVLARGSIPADAIIIAEAPGPSEDAIGKPMVGPAGKLLDGVIAQTLPKGMTIAFCNLVCCIPKDNEGVKFGEPPPDAIKACEPRLVEFVRLCKPKLIIRCGLLAKKYISGQAMFSKYEKMSDPNFGKLEWLDDGDLLEFADIIHPASILRADISQQGLLVQRMTVTLDDAFQSTWLKDV